MAFLTLILLCLVGHVVSIQNNDGFSDGNIYDIDSAFSDVLSRVESPFLDIFNPARGGQSHRILFERIRNIVTKVARLFTDLNRVGLSDDATAIKQNVIDVAASLPWFEQMFLPVR